MFLMKEERLLAANNWYKNTVHTVNNWYKNIFFHTKSIFFFLHEFLCKQKCRRDHYWFSSLWLKFVKKRPIFPTFFPNKRRWERDCNIPSWAQHRFKKSFSALKNRTFQVKSKRAIKVNKADHYNFFFPFLFHHFKTHIKRMNETTTNQQDVVLKILQREIDYRKFNCWRNFQCWLFSL